MENKKVLSHLESWGGERSHLPSLTEAPRPGLTGCAAASLSAMRSDVNKAAVRDVCPDCRTPLVRLGACFTCPRCGYGGCG